MGPTYDIARTYDWHYDNGPMVAGPPRRLAPEREERLLGRAVRSTLGVPAGPLLNSAWIAFYAALGWDVVTYKTVRSRHRPCYDLPNLLPLDVSEQLAGWPPSEVVTRAATPPEPRRMTWGISFGMPSRAPDEWQPDVAASVRLLGDGQMLIVSVTASPLEGWGDAEVADDFALCCRLAREAGAHAVECNLSCPNVTTAEGQAFKNAALAARIAEKCRAACGDAALAIKVGYYEDARVMRDVLTGIAPFVDAVTVTNGISKTQVLPDGSCAYPDASRLISGVGGWGVRDAALANFRNAARIRSEEGLDFELIAVSGVMTAEDAAQYYRAGAAAVQSATLAMLAPDVVAELPSRRDVVAR
jgi:dihydroorotate dehydrogenase (NAD+) catalytic subunit